MRKLLYVSILFGIAALLMLLVVGSAGAVAPLQTEPVEGEVEVEPIMEAETPAEPDPEGTAARIDFEIAGHAAKKGHYSVQALGGGEIASWYALDGWEDSGWLSNIDIGNRTVWVEVVYYPGPDTEGTVLTILNHVPDEPYGWVASGEAHALEVAWPDQELMAAE